MELKHWQKKEGDSIYISRVISLTKLKFQHKTSEIVLTEECDEWFSESYTPEEAIELLEEAITWVKQNS